MAVGLGCGAAAIAVTEEDSRRSFLLRGKGKTENLLKDMSGEEFRAMERMVKVEQERRKCNLEQ